MWKSSIQRPYIPAPIKSAPDFAPPTNSFIPRPISRPNTSQRSEKVDDHVTSLPSRSRPSERGVGTTSYVPQPFSGTAARPAHRPNTHRAKPLQGLVIYIEWGKGETKEAFFTFLGRIRLGGTTTNSLTDPWITHFLLGCSTEAKQQVYTYRQLSRGCRYKYQQVARDHSKWLLPGSKSLDIERNKEERRTRVVVWREWLWDVLDGKLDSDEEGKWGIYLRSESDTKTGLSLPVNEQETDIKIGKDPRIRPSDHSHDVRNEPQDISYFATPPRSANPLHSQIESVIKAPASPNYHHETSPEEDLWPSSSYIATPPSTTIPLPDQSSAPIKSTSLPFRRIDFCPPKSHLDFISPPIHPTFQSTGLFTPPPSASPPPGMRSPEYIMIPKSNFASEAYVWQPPSEEVVASPKYEDSPSPLNEDIDSPSYSPISTPSDPGSPPPLQLEVTVEEKKEAVRPLASRQVSFGIKRPRPRSPVAILMNDRPLAKRQSLPCMQSRSTSRSDSPMTPLPGEDMLDEEDENEDDGRLDEEFQEGIMDGSYTKHKGMPIEEDERELEEDEERFPSPGPSPSTSLSHHSDSDSDSGSDSGSGCGPVDFDDEPDVFSTYKVSNLISKSVDDVDLKTFDLGQLVLACDITDELAGILDAWI